MPAQTDSLLKGREGAAVRKARENGYLDARRKDNARIVNAHGFWCWRLKLPMVWFERRSPRSKYGRVRLDMMTCAGSLTGEARAAVQSLLDGACMRSGSVVSAHEALLDYVPARDLDRVARKLFRLANKPANRTPVRSRVVSMPGSRPEIRRGWSAVSA